ncbi:hypothetical protein UPYG_G00163580 [Umbra pygmaea]|uniref:Uncharacterized protein n=1 Tax=Umbra pygmaea TaxID=75934 RepID=A0ABD0X442_UMBPY
MKVASFNIQKFGKNKLSDPKVLATLVKIVSRYDVLVVLEVLDANGKAMKTFLVELNKEDMVELVDSWQYEDKQPGDEDAFAREPFILRFKCLKTG